MTALFIPSFAKEKSLIAIILFSLSIWIYPEISLGASLQSEGQNQPLFFEVKNPISNLQENTDGLKMDEIVENDPLVKNLEIYLLKHNSPMAEFSAQIVQQKYWQKALAISWVESNFGRFCYDNNCSGIGVKPGHPSWREYTTKLAWFIDLNNVLDRPLYSEKYTTCRKMKGVYVQPGTENWVRGCEQKYNELIKLTEESEKQRALNAQLHLYKIALETFPQNSNIK